MSLVLLLMVQVSFLILLGLMKNSERLGFPIFAVLGKGRPALTHSALRLMGGCRFYLMLICQGGLVRCLLMLFNVRVLLHDGRWLTHGDLALEAGVDFLAVAEHRLIPARVRSEWSRLRKKGLASIWAPASQDSSHVGNAGVGAVSLRGAPVSLPTFATASSGGFFDCGRAVRCLLPLGSGRFMHLVVLYGYQGADADPEQLALTEQLFDALGELSVVARGQPCMLVGDFNVEPTKIPCLAKGISAWLSVDLEVSWALAAGKQPAFTCMREWGSGRGTRRDFMVGCPLAAAAVLSCAVQLDRWVAPHLAVRTLFDYCRWECWVTQPVQRTPFGLLLGCLLLIRIGVPSRLKSGGFGRF